MIYLSLWMYVMVGAGVVVYCKNKTKPSNAGWLGYPIIIALWPMLIGSHIAKITEPLNNGGKDGFD